MSTSKMKNKTALVTGASGAIGGAIAKKLYSLSLQLSNEAN